MELLTISDIRKDFGTKSVLKGISFEVGEKSIFGFIGRNGAGKTTTMKMILGLLAPDSGSIAVCGEKVRYGETPTNRFIGYLPDVPEFYPYMRAGEYLGLCGEIAGISGRELTLRKDELLELVGLKKEKGRIGGYSRGMKQRLGIAQALIGRPRLLICDEPTSALDPLGRREILDILLAAREETSVLFSTHILSDVEKISDHIALLEDGRIMASGPIEEVKAVRAARGVRIMLRHREDERRIETAFPEMVRSDGFLELPALSEHEEARLFRLLADEKIGLVSYERKEPDLEEVFMEVIRA